MSCLTLAGKSKTRANSCVSEAGACFCHFQSQECSLFTAPAILGNGLAAALYDVRAAGFTCPHSAVCGEDFNCSPAADEADLRRLTVR